MVRIIGDIMGTKNFLNYINVFRGLAILLIIAGHTMQIGDVGSFVHKINCEIVCGGTALFIFISGFLFQHLSGKFEYKTYLSKKWTNVILPYIFTAIPGIFFCFYCPTLYKNTFDGLNPIIQIPVLLSIGRVHNVPTWFIPMIVLFFFCSWALLKLEKKNILYKLLPIMFLVTFFLPRGDMEYEMIMNLSYTEKYFAYIMYVLTGFIHFFSLYVFGMFCSKNKDIIDKFYNNRKLLWILMIFSAVLDIYLPQQNFTISKTFLTMLLLGYLKHFDNFILSNDKLNKTLDFIAKYSFGLFFVHWYWLFVYNQIMGLPNVLEFSYMNIILAIVRFMIVTILSLLSLVVAKKVLLKMNNDINTRKFLGV